MISCGTLALSSGDVILIDGGEGGIIRGTTARDIAKTPKIIGNIEKNHNFFGGLLSIFFGAVGGGFLIIFILTTAVIMVAIPVMIDPISVPLIVILDLLILKLVMSKVFY